MNSSSLLPPLAHGTSSRVAVALLASAIVLLPGQVAQAAAMYKCTTETGALIYSDRPCAKELAAAGRESQTQPAKVVDQEVLRLPDAAASGPALPDAASIRRRCEAPVGASMSMDVALRDLPERQRQAFEDTLRGVALGGIAREDMQASTLHLDRKRTLVWCLPKVRERFAAFLVEPNGRVIQLHRSGEVETHNDANDPITLADRCSAIVSTCYQPGQPGHSIDQCFATAPTCPTGYLDPASSCCSPSSKAAYQRERAAGTDPLTASTRALFGR